MKRETYDRLAKSLGVSGLRLFQAGVRTTDSLDTARGILAKMGVLPEESAQVAQPARSSGVRSTSSEARLAASRAALRKAGML